MAKQPKIHTVYTLQVKANGTQQFGQGQVDDMMESIAETVKQWFPKGAVEFTKHDVANGDKRVVITNVLPSRVGRGERTPKIAETATEGANNNEGEE